MAEVLREFGYMVFQANSDQKAPNIMDEGKKIDLVLAKIFMLGELDGRDAVRWLRMARKIVAIDLSSYPETVGESD